MLRWPLALVATLALLAGCATLDQKQREWIFQPNQNAWSTSRAEGMEDVWITHPSKESGRDVTLHALWLPHPKADAPVLLYLHGARRNIWGSTFRMRNMQELGFAVLAVDYRGFGQSTAELPSEDSVLEDARAAWEWIAREHPGRARYIFGHSLGGAIAIDLANATDDEAGVMVEATFTSIADVVGTMRWGWLPVGPLITQRFDSVNKVAHIGSPLLVVHGSDDRLIPAELGRRLYDAAREPKRWVLVEGGTHHNTQALAMAEYRRALRDFFELRSLAQASAP